MKYINLFLLLFTSLLAKSQLTLQKQSDSIFAAYTTGDPPAPPIFPGYYIALWEKGIPEGVQTVRQWNPFTAIVWLEDARMAENLGSNARLAPARAQWKQSLAVDRLRMKEKDEGAWILLGRPGLEEILRSDRQLRLLRTDRQTGAIIVSATWQHLCEKILPLPELIFLDRLEAARSEASIIGYDRAFHGINALDYLFPDANGHAIVVGVKEQNIDPADIDLWKRILPSSVGATTTSYHANVIASIIGGAGNSYYDARGIAPGARFFPSSFSNLFVDDAAVLQTAGVSVQNHSYGTVIQPFYGAEALSYDLLTWKDKTFLPVFSSGNMGEATAPSGPYSNISGFANLTGNFKEAKNVITVGAMDGNGNIAVQSSAGPLYDGRLAPQLVALGPNGTSDAAAMVSGTIAVLQQVYRDAHGVLPPASLVKAVLFNSATSIHNRELDYKTGYGMLDALAAVQCLQRGAFESAVVGDGGVWTTTLSIPPAAASLKVTLSWTDTAAPVNNGRALRNDLDLEVVSVATGTIYQPWILSTAAHKDSLQKAATRGRDSLNTSEQVSLQLPASGDYLVRVKGSSVENAPLPFHIAYKVDTLNQFAFTSPLHPADLLHEPGEPVSIRWHTHVADTNTTASLSISHDGGSSWQTALTGIRLHRKRAELLIPDTAAVVVFKMETPFGAFLSNPLALDHRLQLQVDFNCADSFRLSWNAQRDAIAYQLFTLMDSPYLKPIMTLSDSFVVLQKNAFPSRIYAVQPMLASGLPAVRSAAQDIALQGARCFYKSFNYTLFDGNRLQLTLELGLPAYADSVFFEKLDASGNVIQGFEGQPVTGGNRIYRQWVDELQEGITYLRAKILLKSGVSVFTETIQVLTSGAQQVWFFPVPARRGTTIQYAVRQGLPAGSALRLYDSNGRLLQSHDDHPGSIRTAALPSGLIFYRLVDPGGKLLQSGRLLILP